MKSPRITSEMPVSDLLLRQAIRARTHLWPFLFTTFLLFAFYWASLSTPPGWLTYILSTMALLITAMTALARLNDISTEQTSPRWNTRRVGLILVGVSAVALVCEPLVVLASPEVKWQNVIQDFPNWREVMLRWGVALVWITTPHMPPWWNYITGRYKTLHEAKLAETSPIVTGLLDMEAPQYVQGDLEKLVPRDGYERRSGVDRRKAQ